jgi:AcrR family transcriptional regulator
VTPGRDTRADTPERILDATLGCIRALGLRRLTLEDVAAAATTSRQTVYRHFGSREGLLEAVILREERLLLAEVEAATRTATSLEDAIRAAVMTVLESARAHPLLDRLLEDEPGALLPFLALGRGPVVSAAEPVVRDLFVRFLSNASPQDVDALAGAATRLMVSYTLAPADDPRRTADTLARLFARGVGPQ